MNIFPLALIGGLGQATQPLSLDQALALAVQNRPAIRAAQLRLESARQQKRALTAPQPLRLDLQTTSNRDLYGNDDDVAVSQAIDLFGRRRASQTLGSAQVQFAEANVRQVLFDLQNEVVERFAEAAAATQLEATARAQVNLAERLLDATQKRAEGGAIPQVQVKRARLEVDRARQALLLRRANQQAAQRRLAGTLGVPTVQVDVRDFSLIQIAPIEPESLTWQRPDLLQLTAQFAIARANIAISRVQFRPDFELSARVSPYSYGTNAPAGIRATLSIPIFDYGRTREEVRAGQSAAEAERKALADATAVALAELDAVTIELQSAQDQSKGFEALLSETRELLRVSEVGYREGATTLLEVLEATRALREVEESLIEAKLRVAQAQASYLRTTGMLLNGGQA